MASRFDEAAAQWDNNPGRVELARAVGEAIGRAVPFQPGWRALDFGAGTGLVTLNIQPRVASIVAVDVSSGMLEVLEKKFAAAGIDNVQSRLWDLESRPYPETGFDLVISSMTLHHLPDVPLIFKRLAAVLKPGGWLAVADLDSEDGSFHRDVKDVYHKGFARDDIRRWLQDAGFVNISIQDAHRLEKPDAAGNHRAYGVFLATGSREPALLNTEH